MTADKQHIVRYSWCFKLGAAVRRLCRNQTLKVCQSQVQVTLKELQDSLLEIAISSQNSNRLHTESWRALNVFKSLLIYVIH